ncbi:MAG: response regulator [Desulfobacula sp.]|nr:response regulator [Desulfobacula sp.]
MNLCTNAYHAMEEKGGTLTVSLNEMQPNPKLGLPLGKYCCLSIGDTGSGIPSEVLNNIFDPYFTTKEQGKGSGLGLSVIHGIVKSYKGTINIKSQTGKGTQVDVFLPITREKNIITEMAEDTSKISGEERILFVDDEKLIVKLNVRLLERMGYTVIGKTSSTKALELFKSNPYKFDLVITDMTMPGLLGTQLAKKLLEIRPDLPILICTGFSERVDQETASSFGIKGYINKPILLEELSLKVRELLDQVPAQN